MGVNVMRNFNYGRAATTQSKPTSKITDKHRKSQIEILKRLIYKSKCNFYFFPNSIIKILKCFAKQQLLIKKSKLRNH